MGRSSLFPPFCLACSGSQLCDKDGFTVHCLMEGEVRQKDPDSEWPPWPPDQLPFPSHIFPCCLSAFSSPFFIQPSNRETNVSWASASQTLEGTGSTWTPFPEALILWVRGEPRNLPVMNTVGASVHGLRTTLEETLLGILRGKRWCPSKQSPRSSGWTETSRVVQYGENREGECASGRVDGWPEKGPSQRWHWTGTRSKARNCQTEKRERVPCRRNNMRNLKQRDRSVLWEEYAPWVSCHE